MLADHPRASRQRFTRIAAACFKRIAVPWLGPVSVALLFVALAVWSWQRTADVVIDFGAELYVPWRLSLGDVLHRDLAYRHGPLSPYLNALWFRLFGASIATLAWANLALFAGLCALVYRFFRRTCDGLTATLVCWVLLGLFGFSQYVGIANYNYVTPYQHAQTHGIWLSMLLLTALVEVLRTPNLRWSVLAGLSLGGVLLTKVELQLPALATVATTAALLIVTRPTSARHGFALAASFGIAVLGPLLAAFWFLVLQMPGRAAFSGLLGNWLYLGTVLPDPFYLAGTGLDAPLENAWRVVGSFAGLGLLTGVALLVDRVLPAPLAKRPWVSALAGGVAFVGFFGLAGVGQGGSTFWFGVARALPLTSALAVVVLLGACLRSRGSPEAMQRFGPLALWAVWALTLLGKMILAPRFEQYGFALAMPATLLLVAAWIGILPALLQGRPTQGRVFRAVGVAAIVAGLVFFLGRSDGFYARKTLPVGSGGDTILATRARGRVLARALTSLGEQMPAEATLLVLPEGASLNYWLRRESSSRYYLFLPAEFAALGSRQMLSDIQSHPPDFVALVDRPRAEFGVGPFGTDPGNGQELMHWIRGHYQRVERFGKEPFQGGGFGIAILRRRGG